MSNTRPGKPRSNKRRRAVKLTACVLIVLVAGAWFARPYVWLPAPVYAPTASVALPVPIMTMAEYGEHVSTHARPYLLRYRSTAGGSLLLYGVSHHVNDPNHAEIIELGTLCAQVAPDIALVESRMGFWIAGFEGGVRQFGESAALAWYASEFDATLHTLELPLADEVARVLEQFEPEHVALFYILRPYFGARRGGPIDDPASFIAEPLRKRSRIAGLDGVVSSIEDIDAIWERDFEGLPDWRDCDDRYGWPGLLDAVAGRANIVRNEHWIDVIHELLSEGRSVVAVVGCSHAVRLQPALDALFEADERNPRIGG